MMALERETILISHVITILPLDNENFTILDKTLVRTFLRNFPSVLL